MRDGSDNSKIDELLASYLEAADEACAQGQLDTLFEKYIDPQIIFELKAYSTLSIEDKEEICSKAHLRLVTKFRKLRTTTTNGETAPIENTAAYIKTVIKNLRIDHLLAKHPEWRHAANRLKHLASDSDRDLEIFYDVEGVCCVRLMSFDAIPSSFDISETVRKVRETNPRHLFLKIQELTPIVLNIVGHAVYRNDLVRSIVEITGSMRFEEVELPEEIDHLMFDRDKFVESDRQQVKLRLIWSELIKLPPNQRKALLLSLRETRDTEAITLVLKRRIASIAEVADALEIGIEEFSEMFQRLPMSSSEIAELLGIEGSEHSTKEQKVDNLRSVARQLLKKRLGFGQKQTREKKKDGR
ncbi:MAG: hypothetical protein ABL999_19800 [Pyrinomonadaceae bacterium]